MSAKDLKKTVLRDISVELSEEFDRNFERKAFFDRKWPATRFPNKRGTMMMRSGKLRRSIARPKVGTSSISWESSLPYASLQNDGGEIVVTAKMKRFFWAMYYKASNAISKTGKTKRDQRLSQEAMAYKAMALKKVGDRIKITQRRFIGDHPMARAIVRNVVDQSIKQHANELFEKMKKR